MPIRPSQPEEEYFARQEFERRKQAERVRQERLAREEKDAQRQLHYMKCPKCGMDLVEIDYRRLRIDKCTGCEGVWLDAGELETVTEMDQSVLARLFSGFRH